MIIAVPPALTNKYSLDIFKESPRAPPRVSLIGVLALLSAVRPKFLAHTAFLSFSSHETIHIPSIWRRILYQFKMNNNMDIFMDSCSMYYPSETNTMVNNLRACDIWCPFSGKLQCSNIHPLRYVSNLSVSNFPQ